MKTERKNPTQEKGNTNIIQKKEGKSFVKPKGDANSFSPPTTSGKQNKSLPSKLQSNMESSLGQDFSNVGIHTNSQKAVQMKARAFTQSEQIHFAPGEFNPGSTSGQNLIGHEFTHIAQQRAGVVKPTKALKKGEMINDDRGLESEADNFGRKAARGEAVSKYRSASLGMRSSVRTAQAKSNVMQMAIDTFGGSWDTDEYKTVQDEANGTVYDPAVGVRGANIKLKFTPNADANAELIGITQTAQSTSGGGHPFIDGNATRESRAISTGTERGTMIDRADGYNNPIYAVDSTPSASLDDTSTHAGWGQHGWYYTDKANALQEQDATLIDEPRLGGAAKDSQQIFESTALALKGNQIGTYYGSVQWGWKTDAKGKHELLPFKKISDGVPSGKFMRAAEVWNNAQDSTGADTINLPLREIYIVRPGTRIRDRSSGNMIDVPANTRVIFKDWTLSMGNYVEIEIGEGDNTTKEGYIHNDFLFHEENNNHPLGPGVLEAPANNGTQVI